MTETEFQRSLKAAESIRRLCEGLEACFWDGYMKGLRHNYHGPIAGKDDDHAIWLSLKTEPEYDSCKLLGIGYEMGWGGKPVQEAVRYAQGINFNGSRPLLIDLDTPKVPAGNQLAFPWAERDESKNKQC